MAEKIKVMFDDISGKYDLLNDVLSFGTHRLWKNEVASLAAKAARDSDGLYLDCATGTGDIAEAIISKDPKGRSVALDFSPKMIEYAKQRHKEKLPSADTQIGETNSLNSILSGQIHFRVQDIMEIPYEDATFDAATISFGIRNVDDPAKVISEMARAVKPGGSVIVLETGQPDGMLGSAYRGVYKSILPVVGGALARNKTAYKYLPETAEKFPYGKEFAFIMESTKRFSVIEFTKKSFGVAYLYVGTVR